MNTIVKMKFGSHLYGTNTPESDTDYKGIFMPSKEQIYLGRIPKCYSENTKVGEGKNTSEDTDLEMYSLHYFLKLACEGQTVAIDMLNAPQDMLLETSELWNLICRNKDRFISKNMSAFVGYCKRQAAKYGLKGSRLAAAKRVIDFLSGCSSSATLSLVWENLPAGEHIHYNNVDPNGNRIYEICGKKIQETVRVDYALDILEKFYNSYGARAKQAEKNEGIDWKAVSHAMRACYQLEELYSTGRIHFPLKYAWALKEIKAGKHDYKTVVAPNLESWIDTIEILSKKSNYPEKVDVKWWDRFLLREVQTFLWNGVI